MKSGTASLVDVSYTQTLQLGSAGIAEEHVDRSMMSQHYIKLATNVRVFYYIHTYILTQTTGHDKILRSCYNIIRYVFRNIVISPYHIPRIVYNHF